MVKKGVFVSYKIDIKTRARRPIDAQVLRSSPLKVQILLLHILITELSIQLKQVQDLLQERKVIKPCPYDLFRWILI